jgi:hypothetical protein
MYVVLFCLQASSGSQYSTSPNSVGLPATSQGMCIRVSSLLFVNVGKLSTYVAG